MWGDALSFNGTVQYVVMPTNTWFGSQFTIEAWVYERAYATYMRVIDFGNAGCSDSVLLCQNGNTGQPAFIIFYGNTSSQVVASPQPLPLNQWVHLAATFQANTGILYVNGFPMATNAAMPAPNPVSRTNNYIAHSNWPGDPNVNAVIDDVRIWNVARSPADIAVHMSYPLTGTEANLLAYWKFDEGAGTNVLDATTNGYNGTLVNGPQWVPSTIPLWGNALSLNGTNQYVLVPTNTWFGSQFTIESWVYVRSYSISSQVIDFGNGAPSDNVVLWLSAGATEVPGLGVYRGATQQVIGSPNPLPLNQWAHLAATLANSTATLYVNGVAVVSGTMTAPNAVNRTDNYIGRSDWSLDPYANAIFDDLRIWNVARTAGQIQDGMCHPFSGTESNLVAYWKFDEVAGNIAYDATTNHLNGTLVNGPVWTNSTIPPFVSLNTGLPVVDYMFFHATAAWGDYDNDGRLDLLLTGFTTAGMIAQVWRNNGDGTFTNINAGLPVLYGSSVAWGDYDNDGRLDILLSGYPASPTAPITQIWRNNGAGTFTNINAGLPGVSFGSVAWGDYDNDGRLDVLLSGIDSTGTNYITQVWRNNGDGTFSNINAGLPGVAYGSVAWGDYDNDGWLDILLTGETANGAFISQVWHNNGNGTFSNINAGLPGVAYGSVAWGDYDNDGWLDILLSGAPDNTGMDYITQVWRNLGDGTFTNINAGLTGVIDGPVAWGDYDNDGKLDILVSGINVTGTPSSPNYNALDQIWRNNGDGTFTNINAGLPQIGEFGAAAWGDFDNDGRLDLFLSGWNSGSPMSSICRNIGASTNTPPTPPTNLAANVARQGVSLSWSAGSDIKTPATGLSYNIRVGSAPGARDIVSPPANLTNGFRRLPARGNAQAACIAFVQNLPYAIYYWSVQAVDTAFAGSPFAAEQRFAVAAQTMPATSVGLTTATFNGTNYPLGLTNMSWWFEWGATTNYGQATPAVPVTGTNPVPVSAVVTGLVLFTYHYRLVSASELGLDPGSDIAVAMQLAPPQVLTQPAANSAPTSTTLQGTVNPSQRDTFAWFEYGLDTAYGQLSSAVDVGGGPNFVPVAITVSANLLPWMTYHFAAVASNSVGVTVGGDATVTLPGPSVTAPSLSALPNVTLAQGGSTSVWFTVSPPSLDVQVRCSNPVLLPAAGLTLGGSGTSSRSLAIVPAAAQSGSAQVTVTASDGSSSVSSMFNLTVTPSAESLSSLLYLTNAQVVSTQAWRFRLVDAGTGSTNYAVQYRSDLSPATAWMPATNVTALGGGLFQVATGPPQHGLGFYRAEGFLLLMANLNSAALTVEKGAGPAGPVLVFNGVYTGTVTCIWTDQQGTNWTNYVQVNGTTAVIPIPASYLTDDATIGQLEYLTLQLQGGTGFALGATTQSTVVIQDNNVEWQGVLQTPGGALDFGLTMIQTSSSLQGQIQSDGFGFFPTNALVQLNFTESAFTAVATNIPLPTLAAYPPLGFTNYLDFRLDATNGPGVTNVSPTQILGAATLVSRVPNARYLDAAVYGTFQLLKPAPAPPTNQVPLTPAP